MKELIQALLQITPSNAKIERVWSSVKNIINDISTSMGRQCSENRLFVKKSTVNLND